MIWCLLIGHLWEFPNAEDKAKGIPVRCHRCKALMPDMREPVSKHLPVPPEDKAIHFKETKRR